MYKDNQGRFRTQSLFKEFYLSGDRGTEYPPVFTLKEYDDTDSEGNTLPSMRQLFLSFNDPTGYDFAKEVLGSYDHWKRLCKINWFREHLDAWLEELEVRSTSNALKIAKGVAEGESSQAFSAAKWIAERGWEPKKGRPRKADIEKQARIHAKVQEEVDEDFNRIFN